MNRRLAGTLTIVAGGALTLLADVHGSVVGVIAGLLVGLGGYALWEAGHRERQREVSRRLSVPPDPRRPTNWETRGWL